MKFRIKGDAPPTGLITCDVALRAIGQDLTPLRIESLEIILDGDAFIARGLLIGEANKPTPSDKEPAGGNDAAQTPARPRFARRYEPADIRRLDELGKKRKTGLIAKPDPSTLAESLRTVGRVVESQRGRLVRLTKDQRKIAFEYKDENGLSHQDEHYSLEIYKSQQEALAKRTGKERPDIWEDSK